MPGEAVVVIDSDGSPEIEVESTKKVTAKELKKLADARVAKDFFTASYNNPLTERSSKTGRKITLHKGRCRLCRKEKVVCSQEGYSNFKNHVINEHYKEANDQRKRIPRQRRKSMAF
ncbi:hypothetical protein RvY_04259 [Ramazzottius varieornatus]|uniref:Uncharacterized protein n=1 Tax=Ramazzottius varieornatus TaxID=947166 RepID=A0A1D1URQ4_RAMVA|nr:hypothetical protein RvY_04259 [Ramazzottius varieornatus]